MSQPETTPQSNETEVQFEFLDGASLTQLNPKEKLLYADERGEFNCWLRNEGKNPQKGKGYKESGIRPRARRVHQVFEYAWEHGHTRLELTPEFADEFMRELAQDNIISKKDEPYSESSKRKIVNAVEAYFRFSGVDWEPPVTFSDEHPEHDSDPFTQGEMEAILEAALNYQTPPNYKSVSPEERDRWSAAIAQIKGKPKDEVTPEDWECLQQSWKIPSLISTARDIASRGALISRIERHHLDLDEEIIHIPGDIAVKNDRTWTNELSKRSVKLLQRWDSERDNYTAYDTKPNLWLNREGRPYNSRSLNRLLSNLLEEAGINPDGRKLTWHSIRHSTGMYVYDQHQDLGLVAEILRHESIESARRYAHPTPETKRDVIESIQGGSI